MAEHVMEVYHYQDATSDKLWAICLDGARVLTHWGRRTGSRLQGGGPIALNGRPAGEVYEAKVREKQNEGYRYLGAKLIADGVIVERTDQQASSERQVTPTAYTEIVCREGFKEKLAEIFGHVPVYQVSWQKHPTVTGAEELVICLDQASAIKVRYNPGPDATLSVRAKQIHGPRGLLAVLAIAKAFGAKAFDAQGVERDASWISSAPEQFCSDTVGLDAIRDESEGLGLVLRIKFKKGQGLGLFA